MDSKTFEEALTELRRGHVPINFEFVEQYATATFKELSDYASALSDCVKRQKQTNDLLRQMNEGQEKQNKRLREMLRAAGVKE